MSIEYRINYKFNKIAKEKRKEVPFGGLTSKSLAFPKFLRLSEGKSLSITETVVNRTVKTITQTMRKQINFMGFRSHFASELIETVYSLDRKQKPVGTFS